MLFNPDEPTPKTKEKDVAETPLMKQYNAFKKKHPTAILLFRVGDFYETFGEDAIKASKILGIVLTKRGNGVGTFIELAGFPYHSLDNYLPKLVRAGQRVAICDQLEDPKLAKGIVKRGITELVTPGVSYNDTVLDIKSNNFLASLHFGKNDVIGISLLDISTGDFMVTQGTLPYIEKLLQGFRPSEIIYSRAKRQECESYFNEQYNLFTVEDWVYQYDYAHEKLTKHFNTVNLKGFGIDNQHNSIIAAGAILFYLENTEHHEIKHIATISRIEEEKYVWLDKFTIRNLELLYPQQENGVPLIDILDETITPMGARLLKNWLVLPLKSVEEIEKRQEIVQYCYKNEEITENITRPLKNIGDLERLISKVSAGRINPREMNQLRRALQNIIPIKELLNDKIFENYTLDLCTELLVKIDAELLDEVPLVANQGNLIRENVHTELDELRRISGSGKDYLEKIQQQEAMRTGIPSLKISYNKVFGYYLEVRNLHKDKVPKEWIRKQTLSGAERYITEELKIYEEKILTAEDKIVAIEQQLFWAMVEKAKEFVAPIQRNAKIIARIDCMSGFATVARKNNYVKPVLNDSKIIDIRDGRHPVIEKQLAIGEDYVPNDVFLDDETQQIMIITGPNMAGKSALLRQTALIVLMAQMGSFVPASSANIGLVDKVFTRVGASDNLSKGESTFMVEMTETASILNNLSDRSLVLMDEIGRGTSTYDGISIAWAIVEYLHNHSKFAAKTLFATHYHELNELAEDMQRVKNYNVSVRELNNKVVFMRKLKAGGSEHSFGIHVAQMAGMPNQIVIRANEIMEHLEQNKAEDLNVNSSLNTNLNPNGELLKTAKEQMKIKVKEIPKAYQMTLFESKDPNYEKIKEMLKVLDINTISPVEALLKLNEIKGLMK
jgi:DNA mismatch repair protein MutS